MYSILKPWLFLLDPEQAHAWALAGIERLPAGCFPKPQTQTMTVLGLTFTHRIGLAAGFDKSAAHIDALAKLGFAFIEVGTVTPKPQLGNPKPRLFRLPKAHALINRMGFNNPGIDVVVENLKRTEYQGIIGVNIGKSKDTPLSFAVDDYVHCLKKVYSYASYVAINISSPNTPDLRQLQHGDYFLNLVKTLRMEQLRLADNYAKYVPLLIKISPDEDDEVLKKMAEIMVTNGIDGIIATNTTCARDKVYTLPHGGEIGGLSGRPLLHRSTICLHLIKQIVGNELVIIGVGGIDNVCAAKVKVTAGADLLQVYTGLIYQGPGLIAKLSAV